MPPYTPDRSLNGHEVLEAIKTDADLATIPVVILTTSDAMQDRHAAYAHHANSYVLKPLDFDRFQDMVKQLGLYWTLWNVAPA